MSSPIQQTNRSQELDILRGVAVFGLILCLFAYPDPMVNRAFMFSRWDGCSMLEFCIATFLFTMGMSYYEMRISSEHHWRKVLIKLGILLLLALAIGYAYFPLTNPKMFTKKWAEYPFPYYGIYQSFFIAFLLLLLYSRLKNQWLLLILMAIAMVIFGTAKDIYFVENELPFEEEKNFFALLWEKTLLKQMALRRIVPSYFAKHSFYHALNISFIAAGGYWFKKIFDKIKKLNTHKNFIFYTSYWIIVAFVGSILMNPFVPINYTMATTSFVLYCSALCAGLYFILYLLKERKNWQTLFLFLRPLHVLGKKSLWFVVGVLVIYFALHYLGYKSKKIWWEQMFTKGTMLVLGKYWGTKILSLFVATLLYTSLLQKDAWRWLKKNIIVRKK